MNTAVVDVRHEEEMQASATSNKTELSRVAKELEVTKATLAHQKMTSESLNSQVSAVLSTKYEACSAKNWDEAHFYGLHLIMHQTNRLYRTPNPNPSPLAL